MVTAKSKVDGGSKHNSNNEASTDATEESSKNHAASAGKAKTTKNKKTKDLSRSRKADSSNDCGTSIPVIDSLSSGSPPKAIPGVVRNDANSNLKKN